MTGVLDRREPRRRLKMLAAALWGLALTTAANAADVITVILDQAQIVRLPDRVATIVVGNPLIADVTVQAGGMMVLTGKGYGVTNIIALDRSGKVLMEEAVQVQGPVDNVVIVYRGKDRESYSCTPMCERRITLGDTPDFFNATLGQTGTRNSGAQGSAMPQGSAPQR